MQYRRFLAILAIFVILGPLIGLLVHESVNRVRLGAPFALFSHLSLMLLAAYIFGGTPALLTGLASGVIGSKRGSVSLWQSWAATALAVLIFTVVIHGILTIDNEPQSFGAWELVDSLEFLGLLSTAAFPATAACWALARHFKLL